MNTEPQPTPSTLQAASAAPQPLPVPEAAKSASNLSESAKSASNLPEATKTEATNPEAAAPRKEISVGVAGLRHYIEGGEAGLPAFFASHPVGTTVHVGWAGPTARFPKSFAVYDLDLRPCGVIASEDKYIVNVARDHWDFYRYIKGRIVTHREKAMLIAIEDRTTPETRPRLWNFDRLPGESVTAFTEKENRVARVGNALRQITDRNQALSLIHLVREYLTIYDYSASGDDAYIRYEIAKILLTVSPESYSELYQLGDRLIEGCHDLKREQDLPVWVRRHYEAVKADPEAAAMLTDYDKRLTVLNHNRPLTLRQWRQERDRLFALLDTMLDNRLASMWGDWKQLSACIFYKKLNRQSLYLLYSRMIQLEHVDARIAEMEPEEPAEAANTPHHTLTPRTSHSDPDTAPKSQNSAPKEPRNAPSGADLARELTRQISQIAEHLIAHCPKETKLHIRGLCSTESTPVIVHEARLRAWIEALNLELSEVVEAFAAQNIDQRRQQLKPSAAYIVMGCVVRHSNCFEGIEAKTLAAIMAQREGSPARGSIERYLYSDSYEKKYPEESNLLTQTIRWFGNHQA